MGQELIELADEWIQNLGAWSYVAMVFAAFVEYVFPPFPGDSMVAIGGAFAWRTGQSWLGVWVAVIFGNALGIALQHRIGCFLAKRIQNTEPGWIVRKLIDRGLSEERITAMQERIRKHSVMMLLVNRFMPSLRALVFLAAGASGLSLKKTLGWGVFGSLIWSAFILGIGAWAGGNAERMLGLLKRYETTAAWVVGAGVIFWVLYKLYGWKRRKRVSPP